MVGSYRVFIIGITMVVLAFAGPALGQFVVQPMRLEFIAPPGRPATVDFQLENHDPNSIARVNLNVLDLSQYEDGSWRVIEPNSSDFDTSKLTSCRSWASLSDETVEVPPLEIVPVRIVLRLPPGVRGFYSAGILVSLRAGVQGNIGLVFEFVIPVLVTIPGRVVRHNVELTDVGIEFQQTAGTIPATTLLSMSVANKGRTRSRLMGRVRVWGFLKDHWRRVTETEFAGMDILPGSDLKLMGDIGRSLPRGKYRVAGWLLVDGRRVKPIEREIDFAGDPSITKVATDAPLDLNPSEIVMTGVPGATRMTVLRVFNASDEEVNVKVGLALPPVLMGVAAGPLRGTDLGCVDWLDITPNKFKLPSYGQQNIRIVAEMPNPEAMHACYYALLGLFATYPDGQNAGLTTAHICVVNQRAEARLVPRPSGPLSLALQTGSKYIVTGLFTNYGNIHFTPERCTAIVTNPDGLAMDQVLLRGEPGIMLPLQSRSFSGELDFYNYPVGYYRVEVSLEYGSGQVATNQLGIQVSVEGERRVIRTVGRAEFEKIGVKWR